MKPAPIDRSVPYFVLWKWKSFKGYRTDFTSEHVNTAVWMLTRHGVPLYRIVCVTDDPRGVACRTYPLWEDCSSLSNVSGRHLPSCYRRLKIFDPATLEAMGIPMGQRVVSLDLDCVILQNFLELFHRKEAFVGWKVPGVRHRQVFNGSIFMFTAGEMGWLWENFHPVNSPKRAHEAGYMGSDQGYLSHQLVMTQLAGGWNPWNDGVMSFARDILRNRLLPKQCRIVFFAGKRKPWDADVRRTNTWILRYVPKDEELLAQSGLGGYHANSQGQELHLALHK